MTDNRPYQCPRSSVTALETRSAETTFSHPNPYRPPRLLFENTGSSNRRRVSSTFDFAETLSVRRNHDPPVVEEPVRNVRTFGGGFPPRTGAVAALHRGAMNALRQAVSRVVNPSTMGVYRRRSEIATACTDPRFRSRYRSSHTWSDSPRTRSASKPVRHRVIRGESAFRRCYHR